MGETAENHLAKEKKLKRISSLRVGTHGISRLLSTVHTINRFVAVHPENRILFRFFLPSSVRVMRV